MKKELQIWLDCFQFYFQWQIVVITLQKTTGTRYETDVTVVHSKIVFLFNSQHWYNDTAVLRDKVLRGQSEKGLKLPSQTSSVDAFEMSSF